MVLDSNRLYLFGGYDGTHRLNDLHILDLTSLKWHQPRSAAIGAPPGRAGHSASIVNGEMIIYGGEDDRHWPFKDMYVLQLATLTWRKVAQYGLVPPARAYHTTTVIDNKLYVFGGTDGKSRRMDDLSILDTETWTWSRPTLGGNAPLPRAHHSTTFLGTSIFVFGGSAGYGKGCLSDFIRLEFDGLSSWSGPNIERLAIEHSVVKEQCASLANNRDAESRVHTEVISSLDDTISRIKEDLALEQEKNATLEAKLFDAVQEIAGTQQELMQTHQEKLSLQGSVQDAHFTTQKLEDGYTEAEEEAKRLRDEKRELLQTGLRSEALLRDSQEAQERATAQLKSLQKELTAMTQECREVTHSDATLKLELQRKTAEMERLRVGFEDATRRQQKSDQARLDCEQTLEATTAQLSAATVSASAVYEKSRAEFAESTARYEDELSSTQKARSSLETSLSVAEKTIAQLKARLAETEAIHNAAAASNQNLQRQMQALEDEHKGVEGSLMNAKQEIGNLQGEKTILKAELTSERSRYESNIADKISLQSDLKAEQLARAEVQKRVERLEIELKSEVGRRESAERQSAERAHDIQREVEKANARGRSDVQTEVQLRAQVEREKDIQAEKMKSMSLDREEMDAELQGTNNGLMRLREEHDLLLERYAAQVSAFEDLQSNKSTLEKDLDSMKNTLQQQQAENAVAVATRELADVKSKIQGEETPVTKAKKPSFTPAPVYAGPGHVAAWLEQHDLGEFDTVFAANQIEYDTLPYLTETDLITMGIKAVGPRRKLLTICRASAVEH